ncbi:centrosomin-like [Condylostylus longicornis]|uniref:centrosomin-like n=1 Tax=Condylostylus longicornis TaxID=2530218 RepID=UPI00244E062C|nr:centrosomin-like [Condylostylus longicornis]
MDNAEVNRTEHSIELESQTQHIQTNESRDMTMDSSYGIGYRSPCIRMSSPGQGRTVREYEEQMDALRKENFNLKLKIYVLEEKLPSVGEVSTPEGQESLMKQYVENKVDTEILKNDLEEKKELLREAAAAINHLENMLKEADKRNLQIVDELKHRIQYLEHENKMLNKSNKNNSKNFISDDEDSKTTDNILKVQELEISAKNSEEKAKELSIQMENLKEEIFEKNSTLEEYKNSNQKLKLEVSDLKEAVEIKEKMIKSNDAKIIQNKLDKCRSELADKICELDELQEKFAKQSEEYEKALKYIEKLIKVTTALQSEVEELKKDLDKENKSNISNKNFSRSSDKKMQNKIEALSKQLVTVTEEIQDKNILLEKFKLDAELARNETERAYKINKECNEVCNILTVRLEELAGFLDSLLKQKDILNMIAPDKKREIQDAVNKSLDLSRSLTAESLSITNLSFDETNLAQLSNLTGILENSHIADKLNISKDKHMFELKRKLESLREKRVTTSFTKLETKIINKNNISLPIATSEQSEFEVWSESHRNVSFVRTGLTHPIKLHDSKTQIQNESESACLKHNSNNTLPISDIENKVNDNAAQYEKIIADKDNKILEIQCQLVETDNSLKKQSILLAETISELERNSDRMRGLEIELETFKSSVCVLKANEKSLKQELETMNDQFKKIQEERDKLSEKLVESDLLVKKLKVEAEEAARIYEENLERVKQDESSRFKELQLEYQEKINEKLHELKFQYEETLNKDWVQKAEYIQLLERTKVLESNLKNYQDLSQKLKESELNFKEKLLKSEDIIKNLEENVNEHLFALSNSTLEKNKINNEKINLEKYVQELLESCKTLRNENNLLIDQVNLFLNKQCGIQSNEENIGTDFEENRRLEIISPDLGIESDTGRTANDDVNETNKQKNEQTTTNKVVKGIESNNSNKNENGANICDSKLPTGHKCQEIYKENLKLREKYKLVAKMNKDMLKIIKKKHDNMEQFERNIMIQIQKTNVVLEYARNNFTNNAKHNNSEN